MRISEVSEMFDLSTDTLRYYEKEGLIGPIKKNKSGIRDYQPADLERIKFIKCMRQAGLSIDMLYRFCQLYAKGPETIVERRDMLYEERDLLVSKINEIQETLDYLNYKISIYEQKIEELKK